MAFQNEEDFAVPLVRPAFDESAWQRSYRPARVQSELDHEDEDTRSRQLRLGLYDRFAPSTAGAIMGFFGGAAALGIVHVLERAWIETELLRAAAQWQVPFAASAGIAYGTIAACGAILGACFASVTRNLRRFVPLLLWSLVFFSSVAVVVLSTTAGYFNAARVAPAVFAATATFAMFAAFSLPLRRRAK